MTERSAPDVRRLTRNPFVPGPRQPSPKTIRGPVRGCWEWTGSRAHFGHGTVWHEGGVRYVHRLVYEAIYGPFDDDLKVCHRCDNPPCFRPNHLFLGTQKQNVADMWSKDRGWASLTLAEADVVRSLYVAGTGASVLADTFGVSYDCVIRLLRGYHYGGPNLIEQVMGDRDRAVIEAVRAGAMQKDVAKTFGLSEASVSRIMNLGRNTSVTASPIGR